MSVFNDPEDQDSRSHISVLTLQQAYEQLLTDIRRYRFFGNLDALAIPGGAWLDAMSGAGWTTLLLAGQLCGIRVLDEPSRTYEVSFVDYSPEFFESCGAYARDYFRAAAVLLRAPVSLVTDLPARAIHHGQLSGGYFVDGVLLDQVWCTLPVSAR